MGQPSSCVVTCEGGSDPDSTDSDDGDDDGDDDDGDDGDDAIERGAELEVVNRAVPKQPLATRDATAIDREPRATSMATARASSAPRGFRVRGVRSDVAVTRTRELRARTVRAVGLAHEHGQLRAAHAFARGG